MHSPEEAVEIHSVLTEANHGRPVFILPVRVIDHADGTSSKIPKAKWSDAVCTPAKVHELWERRTGGYIGVYLARSGLTLADQDFELIPNDLIALFDEHPTFTSYSLRRGLPHRWYRAPSGVKPRDRKWTWRGTHIGDIKSLGIGVLGRIVDDRDFAPLPEELDTFHGAGHLETVADGSLRTLIRAWMNYLDSPPTREQSLEWLKYQLISLATARPGERNNALYRASRDVAQVCAAGALDSHDGVEALLEAASRVFSDEEIRTEVRATIESAFERERRAA